jgi:hypothetical protein
MDTNLRGQEAWAPPTVVGCTSHCRLAPTRHHHDQFQSSCLLYQGKMLMAKSQACSRLLCSTVLTPALLGNHSSPIFQVRGVESYEYLSLTELTASRWQGHQVRQRSLHWCDYFQEGRAQGGAVSRQCPPHTLTVLPSVCTAQPPGRPGPTHAPTLLFSCWNSI